MTKTSKEQIQNSWESFKKAWKQLWTAIASIATGLWNVLKWTYQAVDSWDKKIWENIEKKMQKKWKNTSWNVWHFFRNNIAKILIWASVLTYWWTKAVESVKERHEENTELAINEEEKGDIQSAVVEDLQYIEQWVKLLRDWPLTFYVVKEWEWLGIIKKKLEKIPEFSYLQDPIYYVPSDWSRNISAFNTPNTSLQPWFFLPIPIKIEDRQIELDEFKNDAKQALSQMKNNEKYGDKTKELLNKISEKDVISFMAAYARSETACDHEDFKDQIWTVELHRREKKYKSYSFSYFHILMEKNADWKTPWPWLKARYNLWLTEWDCYDPINACKLFLGYCFEKKNDPTYFFKINNLWEAKTVWWAYNWDSNYWNKLRANITYCKNH